MNIFYIDADPAIAAKQLCDQHICKMQIESAQMLSTAHWENGSSAPYKVAHKNHPSTKWARESIKHYRWLTVHGLEICREFERRYGKRHKTQDVIEWLEANEPKIPDLGFKAPPQCMPDEYKLPDTVEAYRKFYVEDKIKVKGLKWKNCSELPKWLY
jgi:Pyrimidine dimer DNA glycosylase